MHQMGEYVVTVTAAAMISSILLSLMGDSPMKSLLRLLCGVFLTVTVISPFASVDLPDLPGFFGEFEDAGSDVVAMGTDMAADAQKEIIKHRAEAYILDKAQDLGLDIQAEVTLSREGIPERIHIWPEPGQEEKDRLSGIITTGLGISKENQQWSGLGPKRP